MKILVDADACPNVIKQIIFKAAKRLNLTCIAFANHPISVPHHVRFFQVPKGFDEADRAIEEKVDAGDLVITADIPLADAVIDKNATALNPRGTLYTKANIKEKLGMRDFQTMMRDAGEMSGGPAAMSKKDQQNFANALDKFLAQNS